MRRIIARPESIEYFRRLVREMTYRSPVYRMLKQELSALGFWRQRPRGKPDAKYFKGKGNIESEL